MEKLIISLLLLFSTQLCHAEITGNDILTDCPYIFNDNKSDHLKMVKASHCMGFISGLNDMAALFQSLFDTKAYCLPEKGLETGQVMRVFIKWLDEHPESLHESARSLFISAFNDAFPCKE